MAVYINQQKTPEDVIEGYRKLYQETDELCEKHHVNLMQPIGREPFCPMCAIIRTAWLEAEMIEEETNKALQRKKRWLRNRSILADKAMLNMTFETFEEMDQETIKNKEKALNMARRYYKGSNKNELLAGKFGTGKSHLAMAILNQLNEHKDLKALFVSMDELMRRIKSSFGNPKSPYQEDIVVNMLIEADLLVLDDLGAEVGSVDRNNSATDYNIRVMNGILNGRTNKPTIFTTNLSMKELHDVYDGRLVSRMFRGIEQENIIEFKETPDKRTQIEF